MPFGDAEQVFHIGPASIAVPGMLQGLFAAWERFGRMSLPELVAPGVELARTGVVIGPRSAFLFRILGEMLCFTPDAAAVYAPGGSVLGEGEVFRNPALAETLEELGRTGAASMGPGGWLAERIVEGVAAAGGLVTATDMAEYRVIERRPLEARFRGRTVFTNPPPSSGGVLIAAALSHLDGRPVAGDVVARYRNLVRAGEFANSLRTEAFAQRLHEVADAGLTDWAEITGTGQGLPVTRGPNGTTHVSVIDRDGMIASLSSSNGTASGVMVPGTGFLLNNMMGEEDLNPGGFGSMSPGMRMTSMMAPTIVMDGARPCLGLGSAGSNRLRSAILQTLVGIIDDDLPIDRAVARPRVHPERGGIDVEGGVPDQVPAALEAEGCLVRRWSGPNLFFGGVSAVGWQRRRAAGRGRPAPRRRRLRGRRLRGGDRAIDRMSVEHDGTTYELVPEGVRTSLADGPAMLWGFQVKVMDGARLVCIKTCFVGRVSVQVRNAAALDAPAEILIPVLHELALEKVAAAIREGDLEDELVFA